MLEKKGDRGDEIRYEIDIYLKKTKRSHLGGH